MNLDLLVLGVHVYEANVIRSTGITRTADIRLPGGVGMVLVLCWLIRRRSRKLSAPARAAQRVLHRRPLVPVEYPSSSNVRGHDCGQTGWQRQLSYRIKMADPRTDSGGDAAKEAHWRG